jgi:glycosyltransferase involved in cell wall biosynthesis
MVFHFPPISGGGVVVIVELANKLAQLGHEVTILTPDLEWDGEKYEPELDKKIIIHKVTTPSKSNLKIAARRCFKNMKNMGVKLGQQNKYDFIFSIFHPFHMVPKAAVSCGNELKIPVIIKVDDAIYQKATGLKNIQRKIEKIYNSKTLQRGDKILVSNEYTKEVVHDYYHVKNEKISIITNGTELSNFYKSNSNSKQIIFSGAMYHHRGIDILLESVSDVIKKIPETKFVLLGDGPEMQKLKELVKNMNLTENVIFKGWVNRKEIPKYLSESAIGIGPLRITDVTKHALPIKVLEYMASSLPIIAINKTLPSDVLKNGENGFLIEDSKELSQKIIQLLDNDELRLKMGEKSREMVTKFDWENVTKSIIKEYELISSLSK